VFVREDMWYKAVKADLFSTLNPVVHPRRTSIGRDGVEIHTIEHLMATFSIFGIDNIQVNLTGKEIPGMDGSAKEFALAIEKAGTKEQEAAKTYITIKDPIYIDEGGSSIVALPSSEYKISYTLKYDNPYINTGFMEICLNGSGNNKEVTFARTFCLEEEIEPLVKMGLGKGANYENTLVISKNGVLKNELRYRDEFVRHKVLDLLGDLYLAGPLKAHIIAIRSGHNLNIKLLEKMKLYHRKSSAAGVANVTHFIPKEGILEAEDIMKVLPHRWPFLLVDRIIHLEQGRKAVGIKNVTINDYFFQGHFPSRPVMPGVLLVEAMAQVGGILMLSASEHRGKIAYFLAADNVKFRKTVTPGDQVVLEVEVDRIKSRTGQVKTKALVDGKIVAEAMLKFILSDS
jgi:UDP-3-O-[3-hydroxymyristoyl] N-acetylglucosamine deacetylase/3-hydroxyacyl-[acyl-carrier-protein] dehydratase